MRLEQACYTPNFSIYCSLLCVLLPSALDVSAALPGNTLHLGVSFSFSFSYAPRSDLSGSPFLYLTLINYYNSLLCLYYLSLSFTTSFTKYIHILLHFVLLYYFIYLLLFSLNTSTLILLLLLLLYSYLSPNNYLPYTT